MVDLGNEVFENKDYENNLDSIVEKVFREFGIEGSSNLDAAKSRIKVSKSNFK
ncbi:hypothetical protein [Tissierella sp. Yu-01]|uniref:hypothetical protein n=1 Tax=Tissierella sp. Yu-01 TaxID=3035694 RepID=UPI00240D8819|nr:hypothetical protein [Tissierella sp. Yu-01]WFA08228.1 hypothetical protein P3962_10870 [Tissierella sp. Yu-01]